MSVVFQDPGPEGVAHIVIDRRDDRVNAIDPRMIEDLSAAVALARSASPRGLVVRSAKPEQFVGGADLTLIGRGSAEELREGSRTMQRVLDELAGLPCTVVAAINGSALGGGCELALACDWRIAADHPSVRIGLPEVQLGLLPAAGGTQRAPRLLGLPRALDLILNARRLTARRALRAGLVDEIVHPAVLERAAIDHALRERKRKLNGGLTPIERAATWFAPARAAAIARAKRTILQETRGLYPAPLRALDAVQIGLRDGVAAGYEAESRAFSELAAGQIARNLIALLFLTLRQRSEALAGFGSARPVRALGIVGAGFMGSGIAQAGAVAGMTVRVRDIDDGSVARGLATARSLTDEAARKGVFDRRDAARIRARVSGTTDYSGFKLADLVIEAVFEDLETKRRVVTDLEDVIREDAVIASNTSALPITDVGARARRPERIVGMHFFSPVHRMPLLEVVRPARAEASAVATAVSAGQAMGKTVIVVRDGPGFYTTRVLGVMLAEAMLVLEQGGRIDEIDAAMTDFGWPVGPFVLLDEVGLPVALHAGTTVARARGLDPPALLGLLVREGLQGKRSGAGFYRYGRGDRSPNPRVYELRGIPTLAAEGEVAERLTLAFANEAARCLDEEVLRSPVEGDLGAVLGLGFPAYLGGPFRYADALGDRLRTTLDRLAEKYGPRFVPADSLREGRRFHG